MWIIKKVKELLLVFIDDCIYAKQGFRSIFMNFDL